MSDGEPCDSCTCQLSDDDVESRTIELPSSNDLESDIRDYILNHTDLEDEDTFIWNVEICPEGVTASVTER